MQVYLGEIPKKNTMNDNRGGNSGFLLGLIIGGAAVFLLGTDKGRKILKSLTEEGFGELSEIIEEVEENLSDQEGYEEEPVSRVKKAKVVEPEIIEEEPPVSRTASPKKRFFRRAKG